jgi:hypothetical protein
MTKVCNPITINQRREYQLKEPIRNSQYHTMKTNNPWKTNIDNILQVATAEQPKEPIQVPLYAIVFFLSGGSTKFYQSF